MRARVLVACGLLLASACAQLSGADKARVAADAVSLAVCQAVAHDCKTDGFSSDKCWAVYDACVEGHGLKDGGL